MTNPGYNEKMAGPEAFVKPSITEYKNSVLPLPSSTSLYLKRSVRNIILTVTKVLFLNLFLKREFYIPLYLIKKDVLRSSLFVTLWAMKLAGGSELASDKLVGLHVQNKYSTIKNRKIMFL
jgi:hypothetical protein